MDYQKFTNTGINHQSVQKYFQEALNVFNENAEAINLPGSVCQKLKLLLPRLLAKGVQDYGSSLNGFVVLNHGDFWTKNIFIKYKNEEPLDAIFV